MDENGSSNAPNKKWKMPLYVFFKDARNVFKLDALSKQIIGIAFPSALAVAADPIASLIDTAFIGHLGPVELAAAGVSIALFNQASRITIFPLVSITTSFVAEEDTIEKLNIIAAENKLKENVKLSEIIMPEDHMIQDIEKAKPLLSVMGVKHDSPMLAPALKYLRLRSFGAPAVLLSLAMQGIFRGFKDTTTPLYVIPSLAARLGSIPMAAFQTCLQVWLTSSLLADGLAVAVQAILACSFAEKDYKKATSAATRTLQMGFILGMGLSLAAGFGLYFGAGIFSRNADVVRLIRIGIPFVAATQPINSLAFVFDGVNYGASDFAYSAYSLVIVSMISIATEFLLYRSKHFIGIWIALSIYMTLRMLAGVWRMGTGTGPWRFLRENSMT
ncbi:unnamed protein product [Lupinus luteus]|uniref:Protein DETOXIFICATION n=1 Tax=Lupinus luteus TaxID=3873 RepID=A0AAV1W297_LUPLU